jgi:signal peptidase II
VRSRARFLLAAGLVGAVMAADQASKWVVRDEAHSLPRTLIDGVAIELVHNRGISFGNFAGGGAVLPVAIGAVTAVMLALLVLTRARYTAALALIVGGSVSNLADRVRWGYVVDFVTLPHWPTFNLADAAIATGAVLLAVRVLTTD